MAKKTTTKASKTSEAEIDNVLAELVYLKDGENDELGKLLGRAIKVLKGCRQDRAYYRQLAAEHKKLETTHNALVKAVHKVVD